MLGFLSSKVLGQFDPFHGPHGRLLLVAPNIVHVEREIGADPTDFRLWVCLHEETHRVQFTANPWLGHHLMTQIAAIAETSSRARCSTACVAAPRRSAAATGSVLDLVSSPEQKEILDRVTGVMSLLEGHADVVMDGVGPRSSRRWRRSAASSTSAARASARSTSCCAGCSASTPRWRSTATARSLRAPRRRQGRHGRVQRRLGRTRDTCRPRPRSPTPTPGSPGCCDAPPLDRGRPAAGAQDAGRLDPSGDGTVAVACSGAPTRWRSPPRPSSRATSSRMRVVGVTVDHGLQPGSAEQADRVVSRSPRSASTRRSPPGSRSTPRRGWGPRAAAREARYAVLEQVAEHLGHASCCSATPSTTRPRRCCSASPAARAAVAAGMRPAFGVFRARCSAYAAPTPSPPACRGARGLGRPAQLRPGLHPRAGAPAGAAGARGRARPRHRRGPGPHGRPAPRGHRPARRARGEALARVRRDSGLDVAALTAEPPAIPPPGRPPRRPRRRCPARGAHPRARPGGGPGPSPTGAGRSGSASPPPLRRPPS